MIKYIISFILLVISIQSFSQSQLNEEFEIFKSDLIKCQNDFAKRKIFPLIKDSISTNVFDTSCSKYELLWTETQYINEPNYQKSKAKKLCADIKRFVETNKKTSQSENQYGTWHYRLEYIGNRYVMITGVDAKAISTVIIYYYEKIE
jgi:hypothetical protein